MNRPERLSSTAEPRPPVADSPRGWRQAARSALGEVLDVLFPPRCAGCGDFEHLLCGECRAQLEPLGERGCRRCGGPRGAGHSLPYCSECLVRPPAFEKARSAFLYHGPARSLVQALKAGGRRELGGLMAELAGPSFRLLLDQTEAPLLTWVPAHRSVERKRGYNQAEVLARRLAEPLGAPVESLLEKVRGTSHQQGLDRQARQGNLRGAFACRTPTKGLAGAKGVVIVDDVYTTGATAAELGGLVRQELGLPVYVFTFCRTPLAGGLTVD